MYITADFLHKHRGKELWNTCSTDIDTKNIHTANNTFRSLSTVKTKAHHFDVIDARNASHIKIDSNEDGSS